MDSTQPTLAPNQCYDRHGGTSAAAPLAAGIFALVMQARPDLSWRDLQYLAMDTAVPVEDKDADWQKTAIGKQFSHTFGYGKIDSSCPSREGQGLGQGQAADLVFLSLAAREAIHSPAGVGPGQHVRSHKGDAGTGECCAVRACHSHHERAAHSTGRLGVST